MDDPDGERMVAVTLQQPFDERLALFMFRAGPDAFVAYDIALMNRDDFERYDRAAPTPGGLALLAHHGLVDRSFPHRQACEEYLNPDSG